MRPRPPPRGPPQVKGVAEYAADARAFLTAPATAKGLAFGAAAFLGATFAIALYRVYLKSQSVDAQRRRTVRVCLLGWGAWVWVGASSGAAAARTRVASQNGRGLAPKVAASLGGGRKASRSPCRPSRPFPTRQVDRNKQLVQGLSQYLPDRRAELTSAVAKVRRPQCRAAAAVPRGHVEGAAARQPARTSSHPPLNLHPLPPSCGPQRAQRLQRASGFTPVEVFRKYLWYMLRERKVRGAERWGLWVGGLLWGAVWGLE
jgi:hypothetical protein